MTALFDNLRAPFRPDQISWRIGSTTQDKSKGMALAYIDARDVMERLDEVCGPENWQCRYPHANGKTVCEIGVKVQHLHSASSDLSSIGTVGEWIWKADGAGDSDVEAEKGALSDAFKRAAVRWGIGRYLYDLESPWVEIEQRGKSFVIKQAEYRRLAQVAGRASAPVSRTPEPSNAAPKGTDHVTPQSREIYIENSLERIAGFEAAGELLAWAKTEKQKVWPQYGIDPMDQDGQRIVKVYKARMAELGSPVGA